MQNKATDSRTLHGRQTVRWQGPAGILLACLATVLGGCPAGPTYQRPTPTCTTATDCPNHQVCSLDGYCYEQIPSDMKIAVELVPKQTVKDGGDTLVQVEFPPATVTPDTDGTVTMVYPDPIQLTGSVTVTATAIKQFDFVSFEAKVTLWRPSRIPGRPRVSYTATLGFDVANPTTSPDQNVSFQIAVPPGTGYSARISPLGYFEDVFPPMLLTGLSLAKDGQLSVTFGQQNQFREVTGQAVDAMGQPTAGVLAYLVDADGNRVSTQSAPTSTNGRFSFTTTNKSGTFTLILESATEDTVIPKLSFPVELLMEDESETELGIFSYPVLRTPCQYRYRVMGASPSGTQESVAGAIARFQTDITMEQGQATYETMATADTNGTLTAKLFPGTSTESITYKVTILPPVDSPYGLSSKDLEVSQCSGVGPDLVLEPRISITGTVYSDLGGTTPNVQVNARPSLDISPELAVFLDSQGYSISTTTSSDGQFNLNLDPGTYDLELTPPKGAHLPKWIVTNLNVDSGNAPHSMNVTIPTPTIFMGRVVTSTSKPLHDMSVRVYLVKDECSGSRDDCTDQTAYLLGQSDLDQDGFFQVLLPRP
ncbi:MAG: hypothetical protein J7M25_06205 [Deltaproteobacteria bacterium]|nr:hypothetical protein [Deltaproteobacteria bacterium]